MKGAGASNAVSVQGTGASFTVGEAGETLSSRDEEGCGGRAGGTSVVIRVEIQGPCTSNAISV